MIRATTRKMTQYNIEIVSDAICPWCYVGKRKLEKGIKEWKEASPENAQDTFNINWKAYFLNPDGDRKGVDTAKKYAEKFGAERSVQIREHMKRVGAENGINFQLEGKTGWTGDAHRLIAYAGEKSLELQNKMVDQLFAGYMEQNQDITDRNFLKAAAERAGLDKAEAEEALNSEKLLSQVETEFEQARRRGVTGVPNFVINNKFEIGGAQDPSTFVDIFKRLKASSGSSGRVDGNTC